MTNTASDQGAGQELATRGSGEVVQIQDQSGTSPPALLAMAVQQGADIDKLQKLMDLQERWEKNEARKAYVTAMSEFKANPPEIFKNKHVRFQSQKGLTEYDHATLDHIASAVGQAMSPYGLSFRWDIEQTDGGQIRVTCIITHAQGHSESVPMKASADQSGSKNSIQAMGSTVTYLQRYTLLAATGLAAKGQDDDGAASGTRQGDDVPRVSEEQVANLEALITEIGVNRQAFLRSIGAKSLDRIRADQYDNAVKMLEAKRGGALEVYPAEKFKANLPRWREAIKSGKKTPDDVINTVESAYTLTDEQKAKIRGESK